MSLHPLIRHWNYFYKIISDETSEARWKAPKLLHTIKTVEELMFLLDESPNPSDLLSKSSYWIFDGSIGRLIDYKNPEFVDGCKIEIKYAYMRHKFIKREHIDHLWKYICMDLAGEQLIPEIKGAWIQWKLSRGGFIRLWLSRVLSKEEFEELSHKLVKDIAKIFEKVEKITIKEKYKKPKPFSIYMRSFRGTLLRESRIDL